MASLAGAAFREQQAVTATAAGRRLPSTARLALLDASSTVELNGGPSLTAMTLTTRRAEPGVTIAVPICGSRVPVGDLRLTATRWPREVRVLMVRIEHGGRSAVRRLGDATLLQVSELADLPRLLARVSRG